MSITQRYCPSLEVLECRAVPATLRLVGGNLFLSNLAGGTGLLVETTATAGQLNVTDNGMLVTVSGVGQVFITGTNSADQVTFKANAGTFGGNLHVNTGNGNDVVAVETGAGGGSTGNIMVSTGNGNDTVVFRAGGLVGIGGNATVMPGLGADTTAVSVASRIGGSLRVHDTAGINAFLNVAGLTTGGDLSVSGVTAFVSVSTLNVGGDVAVASTPGASNLGITFAGTNTIGGDLRVSSNVQSTGMTLGGTTTVGGNLDLRLGTSSALSTGGGVTINGDLRYQGGPGSEAVTIATGFTLGGNARFDLGGGSNGFFIAPGAQLAGDLSIFGGNGFNGITTLGDVAGDVAVTLGNGSNGTIVGGNVAGMIRYRGGNGSEAFTIAPAVPATVVADVVFGTGTATFSLISNVTLTGRVRGNSGAYTFVQGGATLAPTLVFENFP